MEENKEMEESREITAVEGQEKGTERKKMEKETTDTTKNVDDSIRREYGFAADVKLKECKFCRVMIPKRAKVCPNCKMDLRSHWFLKTIVALLAIAVIGVGSYCLSAYWGLIDGSAIPGWVARNTTSVPAVSAATVSVTPAEPEQVTVEVSAEASDVVEASAVKTTDGGNIDATSAKADAAGTSLDAATTIKTAGEAEEKQDADKDQETAEVTVSDTDGSDTEKTKTAKETDTLEETESSDEGEQQKSGVSGTAAQKNTAGDETAEIDEDSVIPTDMDENEAAFRADCVKRSYKSLLREQEEYLGTAVMLEAEVICQVDGGLFDENIYYLCMEEESNGIERYYIIRDDRETDETLILEGDTITVYGRLFGSCKVPASLIETRPTAPAIYMLSCDLLGE